MKKSAIARFASAVLAVLMLACLRIPASAADPKSYSCGIQAHQHGPFCYDGGLSDLLAANGLQDSDEAIYVVHQHADACYGSGGCPLEDPAVMAEHPNVKVLHRHDGNCRVCWLEETPYRMAGTEGASEEVPAGDSASADGGYAPECFVVGMPGGLKDTGESTVGAEDGSMYIVEPHVHGADCGGDCGKPVALVYEGDGARRLICGLEEHIHGGPCSALEASQVKKMARQAEPLNKVTGEQAAPLGEAAGEVLILADSMQLDDSITGGSLPNTGGTGVAPFQIIGMAIISVSLSLLLADRKREGKDES